MHVLENHFVLEATLSVIVALLSWIAFTGGKFIEHANRSDERNNEDHISFHKMLAEMHIKVTEAKEMQSGVIRDLCDNVLMLKNKSKEHDDRLGRIEPMVYRHEVRLSNIDEITILKADTSGIYGKRVQDIIDRKQSA